MKAVEKHMDWWKMECWSGGVLEYWDQGAEGMV